MDVCDEIEGGATLSEAMAKSPKAFDRLYVNMIKAGEAGGALEVILRRLAEFQERSQSLKRKVKGAMVYPVVVVMVAVGILTFIMIKIVPAFEKIFKDFKHELPPMTKMLINISHAVRRLLVGDSRHSRSASGCSSSCCANSATAAKGWDTVLASRCRSSASLSRRTFWPAPRARWARWSPAACRFSKP